MKKINLVKRIIALSMAVMMLVLAPIQHTNAFTAEEEFKAVDTTNNKKIDADKLLSNEDIWEAVGDKSGVITSEGTKLGEGAVKESIRTIGAFGNNEYTLEEVDWSKYDIDLKLNKTVSDYLGGLEDKSLKADTLVPVIIEFDKESILEANSDAKADDFTALKSQVMNLVQSTIIARIEKQVFGGKELDITSDFTWVMNAVGTVVPYGSIKQIEKVAGVRAVYIQNAYEAASVKKDDASLHMANAGEIVGKTEAWEEFGYTGKGTKIAILDTGIDEDHQNFAALPASKLTADSMTLSDIATVLRQLNAYEMYDGLTAEDLYYNSKIAYGFNYIDENLFYNHSRDNQGDHGTHVAGIAAANKVAGSDVTGVAPDAQLIVMKVFGATGGGGTEVLLAAIEDAIILGADVINMSLGSSCGFTSLDDAIDEVYETVSESGIYLSISAGNSSTSAEGNAMGTDANKTSDPDNATISQPSTYINATSIASMNNTLYPREYLEVNGHKVFYTESMYDAYQEVGTIIKELGGQTLEFVMVDNYGVSEDDFWNADVYGKIAVVQRGENYFYEKYMNAYYAGAIGVIIYNTDDTEMAVNLQNNGATEGDIPCICVTREVGAILQAAADAGKNTIRIAEDTIYFAPEDAYQMSYFSSWGVSPDLLLKPDITAPGGYIYSTTDNGTYGLMSGTSMAAPNVSGMAAILHQYVDEKYPELTEEEVYAFINAILTSTATPMVNEEGVYYSPRQQGAGLANVSDALRTEAYLAVVDETLPKINLFDDPEKTGEYSYEFIITNFGDTDLWYRLDTTTQTEGYYTLDGVEFMSSTPEALSALTKEYSDDVVLKHNVDNDSDVDLKDIIALLTTDKVNAEEMFRYDLDSDKAVDMDDAALVLRAMVGQEVAGVDLEEKVVKVEAGSDATVTVDVTLSAADKNYMDTHFENGIYVEGFTVLTGYNDAVDLSIPYMGFYGDWTDAPAFDSGYAWEDGTWSQFEHALWTSLGGEYWYPGLNPYIEEDFDTKHISVSPNGDGYCDAVDDIYISLMRNARELIITYTDAETGEEYFESYMEYCSKTAYSEQYQQVVPFVASWYAGPLFDFSGLADGTKVKITCEAVLDYEADNNSQTMEFEVVVDTTAPEITADRIYTRDGRQYLEITVDEACGTAAICVLSAQGTLIREIYPSQNDNGVNTIDITGFGNDFMIVLGDYAGNERSYVFSTTDNDPTFDGSNLYGYRVYDELIDNDSMYGWIEIDKETAETEVLSSEYYMAYALTSAVYIDGYIVGTDANNDLVMIKPGYWDERTKIGEMGASIAHLAFDEENGILYGYDSDYYRLVKINLFTAEVTPVGEEYSLNEIVAMVADADGNLYGMNVFGDIIRIDTTTGEVTDEDAIASIPGYRGYYLSMTYDFADELFYIADFNYSYDTGLQEGKLYSIDPENNYEVEEIGTIAGNAEVKGLLSIETKNYSFDTSVAPTNVTLEYESMVLLPGKTKFFSALKNPWYDKQGTLEWSSSNEDVATVNSSGCVTPIAEGNATITVTLKVNGAVVATDTCAVRVIEPEVDFDAYALNGTYSASWIKFNTANLFGCSMQKVDYNAYTAGEYYDGYIYAFDAYGAFFKINAQTKVATKIADTASGYTFYDMTYDYTTGTMYALGFSADMTMDLVQVDLLTGRIDEDSIVYNLLDEYEGIPTTLAASYDGTLYAVTTYGFLCEINLDEWTLETIGFCGYATQYQSSMTWDYENGGLYWDCPYTGMIYIDETTGMGIELGTTNGAGLMVALYSVPDAEDLPERTETVPVDWVFLETEKVLLIEGMEALPPIMIYPFNATDRSFTCTIEDESVARFVNGKLEAISPGTTMATINVTGYDEEIIFEVHVNPSSDEIKGFILYDIASGPAYFWGSFKDNALENGWALAMNQLDFSAAENVYGDIYSYAAVDINDYEFEIQFIKQTINEKTFECENEVISGFDMDTFPDVLDMAFDYSENSMYAIAGVRNSDQDTNLYNVDMKTGDLYLVGKLDSTYVALTCSTDGQLYGMRADGILCAIDKTTGESEELLETGYYGNVYQSMTYDHNTGNIYWAQTFMQRLGFSQTVEANLILIDVEELSATKIGTIGQTGCQAVGLFIPIAEDTVLPQVTTVTKDIFLNKESLILGVGETGSVGGSAYPNQLGETYTYTYSSDDSSVATVDQNGNITAVAEGTTMINVSCNGKTNSCLVVVLGDSYQLQTFNAYDEEWYESASIGFSSLLETEYYDEKIYFEQEGFDLATADYSVADDCYYAVDCEGYLWKLVIEDGNVTYTKIGNAPVLELYENYETDVDFGYGNGNGVMDLVVNPYDSNLYAVMQYENPDWETKVLLCQINKETGVPTVIGRFSDGYVYEFEFVSATEIIYYDGYLDYLRKADITKINEEDGRFDFTNLAWVQYIMQASEGCFGMEYCEDLDVMFFVTYDSQNNGYNVALYMMDLNTNYVTKIVDTWHHTLYLRDICLTYKED